MSDSRRLIEYEALIDTTVREYPTTANCRYDARRFDGASLSDVFNVRPTMIICVQLARKPYYLEPEVILEKHLSGPGA